MIKVLKYSFFEMVRSRWLLIYFLFFFLFSVLILLMDSSAPKLVLSLLNLILILCPLISIMFATMYYYNAREFNELLLAQPLSRTDIFLGQYLGIALSLSICIAAGICLPVLMLHPMLFKNYPVIFLLLTAGIVLTCIFSAVGYNLSLRNENKIRGFSIALLLWLLFAILYDGIILIALFFFRDYPLEQFAIFASLANPIDLSRILIVLNLETSALMGYTGAVFSKFFGSTTGILVTSLSLLLWVAIPVINFLRLARKKNF